MTEEQRQPSATSAKSLEFRGWGYRHASRRSFVARNLNLYVPAGQHVLLLGASGIGKSTILAAAAGLIGAASSGSAAASSASATAGAQDEEGGQSEGEVLIGGRAAREARGECALMLQDPDSQAVLQRVGDNVAFGLENIGTSPDLIWGKTRDGLAQMGLADMELHHSTAHLSGGQMQRLALAGAVVMEPGVLLLDEPTANLDPEGAEQVVTAVKKRLAEVNSTVVIVEHRAQPWSDVIDRVVVLGRAVNHAGVPRSGDHSHASAEDAEVTVVVADGTPDEVFGDDSLDFDALGVWVPQRYAAGRRQRRELLKSGVKASVETSSVSGIGEISATSAGAKEAERSAEGSSLAPPQAQRKQPLQSPQSQRTQQPQQPRHLSRRERVGESRVVLLSTDHLAMGRDGEALASDISLDFAAGEITALVGMNGAGKSTLALTLAGLLPPVAGSVVASDELLSGNVQAERKPPTSADPQRWTSRQLARRISYVFQNPEHQFATSSVLAEVMLGPTRAGTDAVKAEADARDLLRHFGLERYAQANPYTLSGGEKRRLTVAAALASAPGVIILDEPTFGQDRRTWAEIVALIRDLAERGVAIVVVTHDEDLVAALNARVIRLGTEESADIRVTAEKARVEEVKPASRSRVLATINPAFRLIGAFLATIPLLFSLDLVSASVTLGLEFVILAALGIRPWRVLRSVWPVLIGAPGSALAVLLYGKAGGAVLLEWGMLQVTERSAELAGATALRVLAIGIPAIVLMLGIDMTDLADSFSQVLRLPDRFVYGGLAGMRLFAVIQDDWRALSASRRSRGLGDDSVVARFFPQAFALLVLSIRRSTSLATAMEARGFGGTLQRTSARKSAVRGRDYVFLAACLAVPLIGLAAAALTGKIAFFGDSSIT